MKSGVTDYAEIRKRWREIGSSLPEPKKEPEPEKVEPKLDPYEGGDFDYGCNGDGEPWTSWVDWPAVWRALQ